MVDINISTRGRTHMGRWYPIPDRMSIFINVIGEYYHPEFRFEEFISEMSATVFHELGHIYGFRNGCKTNKCSRGNCWWCNITKTVMIWIMWGNGWKYRTDAKHLIKEYPRLYKWWIDD